MADRENARIVSAPDLTHFGLRTTLAAGIDDLNRQNLITWITDPSDIKIGTRMQKHAALYQTADGTANLSAQDIGNIADYLLSLTPGTAPANGGGGPGGGDPVANGQALFASNGCSACHSTGSSVVVGPGLAGVGDRAGTRVSGLSADDYIRQSVRDPMAYVVEGFNPLMPSFSTLSDAEINDLIAYLKTLN
jgi:cytochrome c2